MSTQSIFDKYANAIDDAMGSPTTIPIGTTLLALRLAIGDAYAAGSGLADDLAAIVASQAQEVSQHDGECAKLRKHISVLEEELASRRETGVAWVAEIDQLRQQLAQMDADKAGLTQRLSNVDFGAIAHSNGNGNGVDPTTPTSEWSRNHPAWDGLSDEQRVTVYRLASGDLRFRNISKEDRIDLVGRVLRHLADAGEPVTGPQFDRFRPAWMPTAGAVVLLAESRKWSDLLDLAAVPA